MDSAELCDKNLAACTANSHANGIITPLDGDDRTIMKVRLADITNERCISHDVCSG